MHRKYLGDILDLTMCFFAFFVYVVSEWPIEHYGLKPGGVLAC